MTVLTWLTTPSAEPSGATLREHAVASSPLALALIALQQ